MSLARFLADAVGDPTLFKLRIAPQSRNDVPGSAWADSITNGAPLAIQPKPVPREGIFASPEARAPMKGAVDVPAFTLPMGDLNPGDKAQLMLAAAALGNYDVVNPDAGAAFIYTLSQSGSTAAKREFTCLVDRNIGIMDRFHGLMPSGFVVDGKPNGNASLSFPAVAGKVDSHAPGVQTAGSASTVPDLRTTTDLSWAHAEAVAKGGTLDNAIYAKVTGAISGGFVPLLVKVGAAAAFGSTATSAPVDGWGFLLDSTSGNYIGSQAERAAIYFPPTPTVATNDVFRFDPLMGAWVPTFPIDRIVPLVNCRILVNGIELPLDGGFTLEVKVAKVERVQGTSYQAINTQRFGMQAVSVKGSRQLIDLVVELSKRQQKPVNLILEAFTDILIGSSPYFFGWAFIFPELFNAGPGFSIGPKADNRTEAIDLLAGAAPTPIAYRGNSYSDDLTAVCWTDINPLD